MNEHPSDDAIASRAIADEREQLGAANLDEGDYFILRQCHGVLHPRARASSIVAVAHDVIAELGDPSKLPPDSDDALVIAVGIVLAKRWRGRTGGDDIIHLSTRGPRAPREDGLRQSAHTYSADDQARRMASRDRNRERARPPNHITVEEFATATGRGATTIQTSVVIGRIPSVKIGSWRFIPLTAIADYMATNPAVRSTSAGATTTSGLGLAAHTGTFSDRRQTKSAEHRAKLSASMRARLREHPRAPMPPEHRARIRAALLGRSKSAETIARMTAARRARTEVRS